jgi:DNA primase
VLLIEGELNGMVTSLALQEAGVAVAVMAVAGAQGGIYRDILKDKDVFLYADKDEAGELALSRWHRSARRAGAHKIVTLKPLEHDACEIAAVNGRLLLAAEFIRNMFVTPARRYIVHISERVAA